MEGARASAIAEGVLERLVEAQDEWPFLIEEVYVSVRSREVGALRIERLNPLRTPRSTIRRCSGIWKNAKVDRGTTADNRGQLVLTHNVDEARPVNG